MRNGEKAAVGGWTRTGILWIAMFLAAVHSFAGTAGAAGSLDELVRKTVEA
jgi:hypothetical protein